MSQTYDLKHFIISEVAADWHELVIQWHIMWPSIARTDEQLDPRCSQQTYHCSNHIHLRDDLCDMSTVCWHTKLIIFLLVMWYVWILRLKRSAQVQYNYNKITQKFCCIAAFLTSAIQLQCKFFYNCCKYPASFLQVVENLYCSVVFRVSAQLQYKKKNSCIAVVL